ncbi:hypothetical protein DWW31_18255 [Clostridium sp. AF15-17LB]|nr:hypothetical protein DWW31_18255 [Clostridium sp. AF15-17LB]
MQKICRDVYVLRKPIDDPIFYVQATNAVPIEFNFRDWTIPDGAIAKVYVTKPSGKATYDMATIIDNTVLVDVKDQTFSEYGTSSLQIQIVKDDDTLVTFDNPVIVDKNYVAGDVPASENQSNFIDEYLEKLDTTITESVDRGVEYIKEKADAGEFTGTISVGTVTTGEPGTQAYVTNRGTDKDAILDMTIPRGGTGKVENIDTVAVEFVEAGSRENIISGETFKIILGKIKKFFADLKTVAFTGDYSDLTNTPSYGGTNILNATNEQITLGTTASWENRTWRNSKSGNNPSGAGAVISIIDAPNPHIKYGIELNTVSGRIMIAQDKVPISAGKTYTLSCYARSSKGEAKLVLQVGAGASWSTTVKDVTDSWEKYYLTFLAKKNNMNVYFGNDGVDSTIQICGRKLGVGDCFTDWNYSPGDIEARNAQKLDKSKVIESTEITEPGFVMDGKTCSAALAELNSKLNIYSETEEECGVWLGEKLYKKTTNIGALPNKSTKKITHNIVNIKRIVSVEGAAYNSSGTTLPLPYAAEDGLSILLFANKTEISITTKTNRADYMGYATLLYTKL